VTSPSKKNETSRYIFLHNTRTHTRARRVGSGPGPKKFNWSGPLFLCMQRNSYVWISILLVRFTKKKHLIYSQVTLILWIRWPFSERKLNMTLSRNYFNLDFLCGVSVKTQFSMSTENWHCGIFFIKGIFTNISTKRTLNIGLCIKLYSGITINDNTVFALFLFSLFCCKTLY
jgi:hypothetical protein